MVHHLGTVQRVILDATPISFQKTVKLIMSIHLYTRAVHKL